MKQYTVLPEDKEPKMLGLFTRDKEFYRMFFPLLVIISLQQLAAFMVNMVDNLMLGTYSELALSGATLVNQLQFVLQQIAAGTGMGIVVLSSQYWGQRRIEPIKKIISVGVKISLLAGIAFFVLAMLMPEQLLSVFTNDPVVVAEGVRYLRIICWTYLLFSVSNSLMYALQSVETAMIGTVMALSTICINLFLNYCLIFGNLGAPELGIEGAAIATLISRSVELVIILVYVRFVDKKLRMRIIELVKINTEYLKDYFKVATPVIISGFLWGIAQAAQTAVLGHIDATVIAANSIAVTISQVFAVVGMACANVAQVVTGKTIGSGGLHKVKSYAKTMQIIFLIIGIIIGVLIFVFKDPIVSLYNISDETRTYAISFLTVLSITIVGSCYEFPVEGGIISGGGSTRYAAVVDNLFMWLFTIPFAALSAFVWGFPPIVTFCILKADQVIKCLPNFIVCNRYRWVKILTRK